ncbi:4Fe-4S dicluster domain-containing protein [Oceanospirillum sediminis]|uniref:4Fe-4S binding protein n=1 Tax=Oceanospirillum sediminis TaxID=2760088 RepID=A0A839IW12_9GAMM|nr:4Fe-4S dicluster domain-containing protein [Oceanospirillum sediminis]MBB1488567.1 4Fe-4S binding protein [Oceanospirillum sediminis]
MTAQFSEQQLKNQYARRAALTTWSRPENLAAPGISYQSGGHLLIIGADDLARLAASQLLNLLQNQDASGVASLSLLITDPVQDINNPALEQALTATTDLPVAYGSINHIKGYLGQFEVLIKAQTLTDSDADQNQPSDSDELDNIDLTNVDLAGALIHRSHFDLVLDLGREAALPQELSPPGYFHVAPDQDSLRDVLADLPNYNGEFEKPLYFRINSDICAHASRGQTGCTRCLDVCPADAISSINQQVEIDSYLCHGAGSCSTACPTGAISYALPKSSMMADYLSRLLQSYREAGGSDPVMVLHGADTQVSLNDDQQNGSGMDAGLASQLIPVELEEVASIGMELWLHMLAQGARQIVLLTDDNTPDSLIQLLVRESQLGNQLLQALGFSDNTISLIKGAQQLTESVFTADAGVQVPADIHTPFSHSFDEPGKRDRLFAAINHLHQFAPEKPDYLPLPAGAPFGQVAIDSQNCTMCLSCAAVCPTGSISSDQDSPVLNFLEADCVQCGLCESACPEKVITREQRFVFTPALRDEKRVLNKDEPFHCIDCGKPFAPTSTVNMMKEKLKNHAMFAGDAIKRLERCEDCRVKDIYRGLAADPQAQLNL